MTREEKDIELIKQVIDTSLFDGVEYFHTYKGIKYYRYYCSSAQGGHTGWPKLAYLKGNKVFFIMEFFLLEHILLDKSNSSQ
ncbi:MAG: hypothetical protein UH853_08605 [Muribaculaceae bacterium]|nr:hypothetical protein [Muribaculaceae bacterium]